jgi:mycothiol synthase
MISRRPYQGEQDQQEMLALGQADAAAVHVVDLPYRLSSWAFDDAANVGLWWDDAGRLAAWSVLQTPFWCIDYALRSDADDGLYRELLAWADGRARAVAGTASGRPAWFVNVFADQTQRMHDLEAASFADQSRAAKQPWSKVLLGRALDAELGELRLPAGVTIRPLAGAAEVRAYVALHRAVFGSENMTEAWRLRTLSAAGYASDLDLVAVAPAGQLIAFCICWVSQTHDGTLTGQIEPLGVHEEWRGQGLGLALLQEELRRLRAHGASRALVETDNYRDAAFALYERAGFQALQDVRVFRKDYAP